MTVSTMMLRCAASAAALMFGCGAGGGHGD